MKILMLVPYLPTITMSGGQTRWYNIIKYLAREHDITLFSLIKDDSERKFIPELLKYCKKVEVFKRPQKPWTLRNVLLSVFGPFPLLVVRNWSFEERKALKRELRLEKYDLIHTETFYVMPHLGRTNVPIIQVEQTIWHEVYQHHVVTEIPLLLRPLFLLDVVKIIYWEKHYWKKANGLFAVSEEDRNIMQKLLPKNKIGIIPNGVDCSYYNEIKTKKYYPLRILYGVSNFEWLQNQEAVKILLNKVWPKLKEIYSSKVKVWIVGRKMPDWIIKRSQDDSDIIVTENIEDARKAYSSAGVMITPIEGGGGTRIKILEAMAAGLPVISTSTGIAGLNVTDGENVFIADGPSEMAKKAKRLLEDKDLALKIGRNAREHVRKYFDWKSIVAMHEPIYKDMTK
ncbi:MAG: Glycosyl transferase group 1 [Candidatus Woesebacteria bacterium GW2011_GWC1_38_13]|uniref:Glycosyl transferase group 1 n=4 Tax=Candidatus Woeseibacteriota TaxID=1752722 RepID=A0A0G0IWJ9_9BACT|nr:MAG: Glycosyl transferase group 1 [Candidatus Woesebacteria bacterium GW2011_GWD1_38_10]KKQ55410.1 MAG: Glycosyl transferase group 1 [Candidatus Woesebacteria bacterium GW2011_GWC1_38_13]